MGMSPLTLVVLAREGASRMLVEALDVEVAADHVKRHRAQRGRTVARWWCATAGADRGM